MQASDSKSAELLGRLERLPFSRWHRNLFTLCFIGVMFDACDFALFGMALPPVAREFGLNQAQAGLLATVGLVGAFLGALFWGTISDTSAAVRLSPPPSESFLSSPDWLPHRGTCFHCQSSASSPTSGWVGKSRSRSR